MADITSWAGETQDMADITCWAGPPSVHLVSEEGTEVKVHTLLLGLYSHQWRHTLQEASQEVSQEVSPLVFILQGVHSKQLARLVREVYRPFMSERGTRRIVRCSRESLPKNFYFLEWNQIRM